MKYLPAIAGALLGLLFVFSAVVVLFHLMPEQPGPPAGSPPALFMQALMPTGYMTFIKVCELTGGLLCMIPLTRNFGLLLLGPIIANILAFHIFLAKGVGLGNPMLIGIVVLAVFLLWADRHRWAGLLHRRTAAFL